MLYIFAHSNLSHEPVLVSVHSGKVSDVTEDILESVSKLKGIHITESILHMCVYNQFTKSQNFPA